MIRFSSSSDIDENMKIDSADPNQEKKLALEVEKRKETLEMHLLTPLLFHL